MSLNVEISLILLAILAISDCQDSNASNNSMIFSPEWTSTLEPLLIQMLMEGLRRVVGEKIVFWWDFLNSNSILRRFLLVQTFSFSMKKNSTSWNFLLKFCRRKRTGSVDEVCVWMSKTGNVILTSVALLTFLWLSGIYKKNKVDELSSRKKSSFLSNTSYIQTLVEKIQRTVLEKFEFEERDLSLSKDSSGFNELPEFY